MDDRALRRQALFDALDARILCRDGAMGTLLAGQAIDAVYVSIAHAAPVAVGLNCATGPEFMTDHLRTLHELAATRLLCYPNAGLPDEEGRYQETPESLARQLGKCFTVNRPAPRLRVFQRGIRLPFGARI